jgi:hypothetical protein
MWYLDSRATHHITNHLGNLQVSSPYNGQDLVTIRDGSHLPITHMSSTSLLTEASNVIIDNVLVVPQMKKNLLSIFKFYNDNPYNMEFDNQKFIIKDCLT